MPVNIPLPHLRPEAKAKEEKVPPYTTLGDEMARYHDKTHPDYSEPDPEDDKDD